jgi:hypothetical protein
MVLPLLAFAAAVLPVGPVSDNVCVDRAALTDVQPQGWGQTFESRHTIFARDYAVSQFYYHENGGGEILWHRKGARWCAIPFKGYWDQAAFVNHGVPAADAREFRRELADYLQAIVIFRKREPSSHDPEEKD